MRGTWLKFGGGGAGVHELYEMATPDTLINSGEPFYDGGIQQHPLYAHPQHLQVARNAEVFAGILPREQGECPSLGWRQQDCYPKP